MNTPPKAKTFLIKTWGCQMNVYDSARMADVLTVMGYVQTDDLLTADLVIFNTCHIREKASVKLFSELGRLHKVHRARPDQGAGALIAVAGCVAQAGGEEIATRVPYVDMIFGPQTYHLLPEMITRALRKKGVVLNTDFPPEPKFDFLPQAHGATGVSAFLAIQEGCDQFCSYCVVPYTRGMEYSRSFASILQEADTLIAGGAKELTLLGQNVNAYRDGQTGQGLAELLARLAERPELLRLRYMTSHPLSMDDELIEAHGAIPKLMPFLHLPIQSGSDKILEAMNRKHKAEVYLRVVEKLRAARPDLALSSDFIVGFPGETEEDFEATMQLAREVTYAQAFSFKYSRRPGTLAAAMKNQIPEEVKEERLAQLQALLRDQQTAFNMACAGQSLPVLFDGLSDRAGFVFGRTPYLQAARAPGGAELIGQVRNVKITHAAPNSLDGILE